MEFKRMKEYFFHMYLITASKNLTMLGFFRMGHTYGLNLLHHLRSLHSGFDKKYILCNKYFICVSVAFFFNQSFHHLVSF